jgi:adenylate cyclase class 2
MYEVEVKARARHGPVRERLRELGADRLGAVVQVDTYYDAPHRDFAATDEALRVRRETPTNGEGRAYLTYKGPLVDDEAKTREEAETPVAADAAAAILEGLGFDAAATVRKDRERYALAGYTVALDDVEGLGEFVEVETETDSGLDAARTGAFDVLDRLGLDPDAGIRTSYLGLVLSANDS